MHPREAQAGLALAAPYAKRPEAGATLAWAAAHSTRVLLPEPGSPVSTVHLRARAVRGIEEPGQTGQLPIPAHDLRLVWLVRGCTVVLVSVA